MINVVIPQTSDYILSAVSRMQEEGLWNVRLIVTHDNESSLDHLRARFEGSLVLGVNDARCGVCKMEGNESQTIPLDASLLDIFLKCEKIVLKMMDRIGPVWGFGYDLRVRHYHRLLGYWWNFFEQNNIQLAIFQNTPHVVYDYIIYSICKHKGIAVKILEKTPIQDQLYWYDDVENGFSSLKQKYCDRVSSDMLTLPKLSPNSSTYIDSLRRSYDDGKSPHFKVTSKRINGSRNFWKKLLVVVSSLKYWSSIVLSSKGKNIHCLSLSTIVPEKYSSINMISIFFYRLRVRVYQNRIKNYYNALANKLNINLSDEFVYFPLQCQPEKSTSPLAGDYVHQLLIVSMLAKTVPKGWKVYVKEHRSQLTGIKESELSRSKVFYDDIVAFDNVELVPDSMDPFLLIDSAQFVVVSTGTTGFEAICRGKNVLLFGETWYSGCDGVHKITTYQDLEGFFCEAHVEPSMERIKLFVSILEEVGFKGYNHPSYEAFSDISRKNLDKEFCDYFKSISC